MQAYRKIEWIVTVWMLGMFALIFSVSLVSESHIIMQIIARVAVLSIACTCLVWTVFEFREYQKPKPFKLMTPYEAELHQEALANRQKLWSLGRSSLSSS